MKNSGIGNVEYESKDKEPMNQYKEKFLYFHKYFIEKGKNIAVTLATLDYLTKHEEDYKNLSTISPAFINTVICNFWAQAVIELDAFYRKNDILSFNKYFNYIKANWDKIFTKDFYQTIVHNDEKSTEHIVFNYDDIIKSIEECEEIILFNNDKLNNLRKFRDKVFAHYDDISKEKEKNTISIDDLQSIFKITEQIINKIEVFYDRVITILNPINVADVFQLCFVVKKYREYQEK